MALQTPSPAVPALGSGSTGYCRKQKSLGLLCSNFLSLYNRDGIETVGLDEAAARLGVERRRIYDIVNVLESVGVLVKKAKNTYYWKGLGAIQIALKQLKEEGFKNNDELTDAKPVKVSDDDDERFSNHRASLQKKEEYDAIQKADGLLKPENRKEKSLGLLTKNFLKLFLCTNMEMLSLDDAAKILLGDAHNPALTRSTTKVRRLYDIANVLSSMNFIEKTHHPETRKPAFRWVGMKGQTLSQTGTSSAIVNQDSKKRAFGTELTNICFKRSKLDSANHMTAHQDVKPLHLQGDRCNSDQGSGLTAPVSMLKYCDGESNKLKKTQDWESLAAAYRPQYQNQALRDLFVHYVDAWKSWYSEVAEMDPIGAI
ncbi:DP-E2F-like 1 [Artemisia annua]|uniref:DP-E2F-like 1 n=1 Tax=Artemisia annua TaxID=35608 RepID=A0A2U1QAZ7_ARTAN|nr:DP-E2F-like 1 [Artemisia annua]